MRLRNYIIGTVLLVAAMSFSPQVRDVAAQVGVSVKNGFTSCSGVNCDNVFTIGGTWKIGTTIVTPTAVELNALAGAGISAAEAAVLGAYTATAAEANVLAGVVAGTLSASHGVVVDVSSKINTWDATILKANGVTITNATIGVAPGYKVARGVATTASAVDTIASGLATVVSVTCTSASDLSTALNAVTCSKGDQAGSPAAGSFYLKTWKATTAGASGNPDPTAATSFTKDINWIAWGT